MTMMATRNLNQTNLREVEMLLNQNDALAEEIADNRRMVRKYIAALEPSRKETNNNREEVVRHGSVIVRMRGQQGGEDEKETPDEEEISDEEETHDEEGSPDVEETRDEEETHDEEGTPDVEETRDEEEIRDVEETLDEEETPAGIEEIGDVSEPVLKAEIKTLNKKIEISAMNLEDQRNELKRMAGNRKGRYVEWKAQAANVKRYILIHDRFVDDNNKRIGDIKDELKKRQVSKRASKKGVSGGGPGPRATTSSRSTSSGSQKRKLDESVIECGLMKKVSTKERDAMEISLLMKEEEPCEDTFECNYCEKSFASAGPLSAHLLKHTNGSKNTRLDCPWPYCTYSNTQRILIKHMRSKHTKEELFKCGNCPAKFHTMEAKGSHVKKHKQSDMWQQCGDCLRFYQMARGSCVFCK